MNQPIKGAWIGIRIALILMALVVGIAGLSIPVESSPVETELNPLIATELRDDLGSPLKLSENEKIDFLRANQVTTVVLSTRVISRTANLIIDEILPELAPVDLAASEVNLPTSADDEIINGEAIPEKTKELTQVPTSVDLVILGEKESVTDSWWWVSWPWLMALLTALSLSGLLWILRRRTTLEKVRLKVKSNRSSE